MRGLLQVNRPWCRQKTFFDAAVATSVHAFRAVLSALRMMLCDHRRRRLLSDDGRRCAVLWDATDHSSGPITVTRVVQCGLPVRLGNRIPRVQLRHKDQVQREIQRSDDAHNNEHSLRHLH